MMNASVDTTTYEDWRLSAIEDDRTSGADEWKVQDKTKRYDYNIIRRRYDELVAIRATNNPKQLLFYLNEGMHGNMAGMGAPNLYSQAKFGTKRLINDYMSELVLALQELNLAPARTITKAEKRLFYRRASMGFGRTALMLSGAGSLGAFHLGAVKTLIQQDLLPRVISGASAGAFVAALLGTHRREDTAAKLTSNDLSSLLDFNAPTSGRRKIDLYDLEELLKKLIPDMTFQEAYEVSNLHINISVAPGGVQQRSRLLNAVSSPTALIREAVMASCALPGLFPAVTLAAKDSDGVRQKYIPSRTWVDGSIMDELPSRRLSRLYGVNYFISSQANPLYFDQPTMALSANLQTGFSAWQAATREWLKAIYPYTMNILQDSYPHNVQARNWFSLATQEYTADINILPDSRSWRPGVFFETLTLEETSELITEGEKSTWPVVERIRITTEVSRCIDHILSEMGEDCLLP
jgi:TAG lipase/steryl ester hydrolase/phospholipase A2/LPA acyltransferase